jgi:hypothetical protein
MFYIELFRQLNADKVRYMVVGGLAMNLLGVPRSTMDVDLVLALDDDNLRHFLATAKRLALRPVAPVPLEDILSPEKRRQWRDEKGVVAFALRPPQADAPTVDLLIDPPLDIDAALQRVDYRHVQGLRLPVISVRDMITLKEQAGREQDLADLDHLRRLAEDSRK